MDHVIQAADGNLTSYSYDPFGNPSASGQNIAYPYQFAGLELDATGLYFNGVGYYDPAFGRTLDGAGVPAAPGSGGMGAAAGLPSGGGGGLSGFSAYAARTAVQDAIAGATGAAAAGVAAIAAIYGAEVSIPGVGWAVAAVTAIVQEVLDAFGIDIFGGSASRPTPPPMDYRFDHYPAGPFIGVEQALTPTEQDSASIEAPKIQSAFAGFVAAAGLVGEEVAEISEALVGGTFLEVAAGAVIAAGVYEVAKHIYAHEHGEHAKSIDNYRCKLVSERKGDNGETTCAYVCKGYGALATFPLPGGMKSCPEGFNGFFPGP